MQEIVMTVSSLCMTAALCSRLLQKNRFSGAVRLVLGLEIARVLLQMAEKTAEGILKWS